jgi:predicted nucleic acid-binding protein
MSARYLLDSVILIDHLRGLAAATRWLEKLDDDDAVLSPITRAEVLTGATNAAERAIALRLLDAFTCLTLTPEVADLAAELRQQHHWKLPDAMQAATARHHHLRLVTRNTKDFDPHRHAFVVIPYMA